jgi:hypothetical protein
MESSKIGGKMSKFFFVLSSLTIFMISPHANVLSGEDLPHEVRVIPQDIHSYMEYGTDVAISESYAVIGAPADNDNGSMSGSAYVFRRNGDEWVEDTKLIPSDAAAGDHFGISADICGDVIAIGASWKADNGTKSGAVYIYRKNGIDWLEETKLLAPDGAAGDFFGCSVSIGNDDVIVGANSDDDRGRNSGSAYIFHWDGSQWQMDAKILPDVGDKIYYFGHTVAISEEFAVVGTTADDDQGVNSGSVHVFEKTAGNWLKETKLYGDAGAWERLGWAVDIHKNDIVVGAIGNSEVASNAGAAYFFHNSSGQWQQQAKITIPDGQFYDNFGFDVAIYYDFAVISAYQEDDEARDGGAAYTFTRTEGQWNQLSRIALDDAYPNDYFGRSVATCGSYSIIGASGYDGTGYNAGMAAVYTYQKETKVIPPGGDPYNSFGAITAMCGAYVIVGASGDNENGDFSGAAYIYENVAGEWIERCKLTASDGYPYQYFGNAVAISEQFAVVGAYLDDSSYQNAGAVYLFQRDDIQWNFIEKFLPPVSYYEGQFGFSLAMSDDTIVIGSNGDDERGNWAGAAYLLTYDGYSWSFGPKLTAFDGVAYDNFGYSTAISGDSVIVGAFADDDKGISSGSAYIFTRSGDEWNLKSKITASDGAPVAHFGTSVSISGDHLVVGAPDDQTNGYSSGAAYIFTLTPAGWTETCKLVPQDNERNDDFGLSAAIAGETVVIGARGDDDVGASAGAVYLFKPRSGSWQEARKILAPDPGDHNWFGRAVSMFGNTFFSGASGSAYIFENYNLF